MRSRSEAHSFAYFCMVDEDCFPALGGCVRRRTHLCVSAAAILAGSIGTTAEVDGFVLDDDEADALAISGLKWVRRELGRGVREDLVEADAPCLWEAGWGLCCVATPPLVPAPRCCAQRSPRDWTLLLHGAPLLVVAPHTGIARLCMCFHHAQKKDAPPTGPSGTRENTRENRHFHLCSGDGGRVCCEGVPHRASRARRRLYIRIRGHILGRHVEADDALGTFSQDSELVRGHLAPTFEA